MKSRIFSKQPLVLQRFRRKRPLAGFWACWMERPSVRPFWIFCALVTQAVILSLWMAKPYAAQGNQAIRIAHYKFSVHIWRRAASCLPKKRYMRKATKYQHFNKCWLIWMCRVKLSQQMPCTVSGALQRRLWLAKEIMFLDWRKINRPC